MFKTTILASLLTLTSVAATANYDIDARLQQAEVGYQEYEAYISIIDKETKAGLALVDQMAARVASKATGNAEVDELIQKCAAELPAGEQASIFTDWRNYIKGDDLNDNQGSQAERVRNAIVEVRDLVDQYKMLAEDSKSKPSRSHALKALQKKIDYKVDSLNADPEIFRKVAELEGTLDGKNYCDFNKLFKYQDNRKFEKMRKKVVHPTLGIDAKLSISDLLSGEFDQVLIHVAQKRMPLLVVRKVLLKGNPKSSASENGVYLCVIYDFKGKKYSENYESHKLLPWDMMNPIKILKRDLFGAL